MKGILANADMPYFLKEGFPSFPTDAPSASAPKRRSFS